MSVTIAVLDAQHNVTKWSMPCLQDLYDECHGERGVSEILQDTVTDGKEPAAVGFWCGRREDYAEWVVRTTNPFLSRAGFPLFHDGECVFFKASIDDVPWDMFYHVSLVARTLTEHTIGPTKRCDKLYSALLGGCPEESAFGPSRWTGPGETDHHHPRRLMGVDSNPSEGSPTLSDQLLRSVVYGVNYLDANLTLSQALPLGTEYEDSLDHGEFYMRVLTGKQLSYYMIGALGPTGKTGSPHAARFYHMTGVPRPEEPLSYPTIDVGTWDEFLDLDVFAVGFLLAYMTRVKFHIAQMEE